MTAHQGGVILEENQGYVIRRTILLDNKCGFVLGENPKAPNPYVTWQFNEQDGHRDFFWECYMFGKCWTGAYCRYFREAVLPLDPALEAALLTEGPRPEFKPCPICGRAVPLDGRLAYCSAACAKKAHRRQQREYMQKKRSCDVDN